MALKTLVKASVNNLTDARYFAALEVEWLSFCLDRDMKNHISPAELQSMAEWITGPKIIGEFGNEGADEINHIAETMGLDGIQLNKESAEAEEIRFPVMQKIIPEGISSLPYELMRHKKADFFVLSLKSWKNISETEKEELRNLCAQYQILLNLDFDKDNITDILEQIQPLGIDITGGEEEAVGVKDFEKIDAVMEKLEPEF